MAVRPQTDESVAFEELWEHRKRVRAVCVELAGDSVAVDDLVQETYLRALTTAHPPDRRGPLGSWLATVARHRTIDQLRAERHMHPASVEPAVLADEAPDPAERLVQSERRERVRRALSELDTRERDLLVRQTVHGWSVAQLAAEFRTSEAAVRSTLWRARRKFRVAVERGGPLGVAPWRRFADAWQRLREMGSRAESGIPWLTGVGFHLVDALVAVVSVLLLLVGASERSASVSVRTEALSSYGGSAAVGTMARNEVIGRPDASRGQPRVHGGLDAVPTAARRLVVETSTGQLSGGADVEFRPESTHVDLGLWVTPMGVTLAPMGVGLTATYTCDWSHECEATAAAHATAGLLSAPPVA